MRKATKHSVLCCALADPGSGEEGDHVQDFSQAPGWGSNFQFFNWKKVLKFHLRHKMGRGGANFFSSNPRLENVIDVEEDHAHF